MNLSLLCNDNKPARTKKFKSTKRMHKKRHIRKGWGIIIVSVQMFDRRRKFEIRKWEKTEIGDTEDNGENVYRQITTEHELTLGWCLKDQKIINQYTH